MFNFTKKQTKQQTLSDRMAQAIIAERGNALARKLRDAAYANGHDLYNQLMSLADYSNLHPDEWENVIVRAQKMGVYVGIDR